ncbi:MAG: hypothetical protein JNJ82_00755 [Opitutaceae bacterium]|nr:hypothetical protein [Opitutaceae bacterium]
MKAERSPSVDPTNPWLGLASFTEETRAYFHGRDEEVAELGRRVQRKLLTILFGQSGLGKTSILRAGLVPRLRPDGYCPVYVRIDYSRESAPPSEQIKQAILRTTRSAGHWTQAGVSTAGETLWEFLHHRDDVLKDADGRTLVPLLIFDQFEEIFTLAQSDDFGRQRAAQFIEDLADLVENRPPRALEAKLEKDEADLERFDFTRADYRLLIALREDYLAHLEGLKAKMPSVTQNRMRLARMTGPQALTAVTGPGGALVSPEVAAAIVRFVAGGAELERAEVEPSLLSLICRELNTVRQAEGHATISADLLAGSRETILTEFYRRALADQPDGVRTFIEDELLTDSGYRESIAEERVKKAFAAAGASAEALAVLVDRRLLRVEDRLDLRRVELTHDVLCGVVRASRDIRQEREARAAEARRREETEAQLAGARAQESLARAAAVRARLVAGVCTVLAVGAIGAAVWGYVNLRRARQAEERVAMERDRAQLSRGEAEKLVTFLLDDLYTQLEPTGRIEIVSGLARRALAYFDALPPELRNEQSDRYRAIALGRLGAALSLQGKTREAEAPLQEAEALFTKLSASGTTTPEVILGLAAVIRQQSRNAYSQNRPISAVALGRRGLALIDPPAKGPGAPLSFKMELGRQLMNLGFVLMRDRSFSEALEVLERGRLCFRELMESDDSRQRARVLHGENVAWLTETLRSLGRDAETKQLLAEAILIADEAVTAEAGNLGALRSRALLKSRLGQIALDGHDAVAAEKSARETAADWVEYLRFDPTNDAARNNRRVALGMTARAMASQGRLREAIAQSRENVRSAISEGGSPSTLRGTAFEVSQVDNLEAELEVGRDTDIDSALAAGRRLRALASAQVDPESYFRLVLPAWDDGVKSQYLLGAGRVAEALELAVSVRNRLDNLKPVSGAETQGQDWLLDNCNRVMVSSLLILQRWSEAVAPARELVRGRPRPGAQSRDALYDLANDRALAGVALARAGVFDEAKVLIAQAYETIDAQRRGGANDSFSRYDYSLVVFGQGLIETNPVEQRRLFTAALADLTSMPAEPQKLRSVRELRKAVEQELARLGGAD